MTPRTTRRKCVSGNTSPMVCAHAGMPRNGNIKPDSRIDGRKKKNVSCIACICDFATVENVKPSARFATTKIETPSNSSHSAPTNGTPNSNFAAARITAVCALPTST